MAVELGLFQLRKRVPGGMSSALDLSFGQCSCDILQLYVTQFPVTLCCCSMVVLCGGKTYFVLWLSYSPLCTTQPVYRNCGRTEL